MDDAHQGGGRRGGNAGLRGLTVLLVEDGAATAFDLEAQLRGLGCAVRFAAATAGDVRAALEAGRRPDAAVLDARRLGGGRAASVAAVLAAAGVPVAAAGGDGRGAALLRPALARLLTAFPR
jgi:DNA-binding NtrC family response regulator